MARKKFVIVYNADGKLLSRKEDSGLEMTKLLSESSWNTRPSDLGMITFWIQTARQGDWKELTVDGKNAVLFCTKRG